MRLYYSCYYDGNECKKVVPKVDKKGNVIEESHKDLQERYEHVCSEHVIKEGWDICEGCERNFSMGFCHGNLKIKY